MSPFGVLQSLILSGSELKNKRDTQVNVIIAWRKGSRPAEILRMQIPTLLVFGEGNSAIRDDWPRPTSRCMREEKIRECLMLRSWMIFFFLSFSMMVKTLQCGKAIEWLPLVFGRWGCCIYDAGWEEENGRWKGRRNRQTRKQIWGWIDFCYKGGRVGKGHVLISDIYSFLLPFCFNFAFS